MGDPISIAGLVLAIPVVISQLMTYCSDTKDARKEIQVHVTDLFSLKGILEYVESVHATQADPALLKRYDSTEFARLLEMTREALQRLRDSLEPKSSSFGQSIQRITWSFKKKEVQEQLTRIERLKSAFMVVMTGDTLSYSQTILSELSQLRLDLVNDRDARESEAGGQKKEVLLKWLAPIGSESTHNSAFNAHHPDTGDWFIKGPLATFLSSPENEAAVLWLQGKSGSGKTTLLAYVVEHLKAEFHGATNVSFAYFYCSFNTLASQRPVNILASLIVQLCSRNTGLYEELCTRFMDVAELKRPNNIDLKDLKDIFIRHTASDLHVFVSVDAINESEDSYEVRNTLIDLAGSCKNLRLILTSTSSIDRNGIPRGIHLIESTMPSVNVDEDIRRFVESSIASNHVLKALSATLKQEVQEAISSRANGVFRYAKSQIARVGTQLTGRDVRRALLDMPRDLNETYERILRRLTSDLSYQEYVHRSLLWLCFATRPLRLPELSEAAVVEDEDLDLDENTRLQRPDVLLSLGDGLFEYDSATEMVSLSHSSVKTFLTSAWIRMSDAAEFELNEEQGHKTIRRICLTYLNFTAFGAGLSYSAKEITSLSAEYPLLSYATHNWPFHVRGIVQEDWKQVQTFLSTRGMFDGGNYGFWIHFITGNIPRQVLVRTAPLYYAASFGFIALLSAILTFDKSQDLEKPGGRHGSSALQVACFRGQREAARILVEAGADPFSPDGSGIDGGFSSLFWAKQNSWDDIVELMLSRGTANGFKFQERYHGKYSKELARGIQDWALKDVKHFKHKASGRALVQDRLPAYGRVNQALVEQFLWERFGPSIRVERVGDYFRFEVPERLTEEDKQEFRELRQSMNTGQDHLVELE